MLVAAGRHGRRLRAVREGRQADLRVQLVQPAALPGDQFRASAGRQEHDPRRVQIRRRRLSARAARSTMFVNDKKVGEGRVEKTIFARFSADETFDTGLDTGSPVSTDYKSPNPFTGKLKKVAIDLGAIPMGIRGDIEKIERETLFRRAMRE